MHVELTGGVTFVLVSAGAAVTCGLTAERRAYCWGSNEGGRLGDGTETQRLTPTPVSGSLSFAQVTPGAHTCGVTTANKAYCWGDNFTGGLGGGASTPPLASRHVT